MIYRINLFQKELSYGYYQRQDGMRQLLGLGVFMGMVAFSAYFVMQTLSRSVLSDDAPYFMQSSFFSTTIIYLYVSYVSFLVYFLTKFEQIAFVEVYENSWYPLVHLGHKVSRMVFAKLSVQAAAVTAIYSAGFVTTLALSSFLKFTLVISYLISLYFVGLLNVIIMLVLSMTMSMVTRDLADARSWLAVGSLAIFLMQLPSGFYDIVCDRTRMVNITNLLTGSWYLYAVLLLIGIAFIFSVYKGTQLAVMFNPPSDTDAPVLVAQPEGTQVMVRTESDNKAVRKQSRKLESAYMPVKHIGVLSHLMTILLVVVVIAMLIINGLMLAFNYASPERESAVMGFIPYIFQSSTMEPTIYYNDIAFFEKVDGYVGLSEGEIILYKDDVGAVQVRKIMSIEYNEEIYNDELVVNITYYPEGTIIDSLKDYIMPEQVYGRLVGTNRYLGVIILFANTMVGRILFLLIPSVLIFFYGQITAFFQSFSRSTPMTTRRAGPSDDSGAEAAGAKKEAKPKAKKEKEKKEKREKKK